MKETNPQMPMPPGMAAMPDVTASLVDRALIQFKVEVAGDIGMPPQNRSQSRGHMTPREAGRLGDPSAARWSGA